jgi:hypothetical protein
VADALHHRGGAVGHAEVGQQLTDIDLDGVLLYGVVSAVVTIVSLVLAAGASNQAG